MKPLARILEQPSLRVFLIPLWIWIYALGLILLAEPVWDVGFLTYNGREVGYVAAINWSLVYGILLPLLLLLCLLLLYRFRMVLVEMVDKGMVVDATDATPLKKPDRLLDLWRRVLGIFLGAWLLVACFTTFLTVWEWKTTCYDLVTDYSTLAELKDARTPEPVEVDWAIASLLEPQESTRTQVWVFGIAAYAQQAVVIASGFLCVFISLAVGTLILLASFGGQLRFLPDLRDHDPRRGFQKFELLGYLLMLASIVIFSASYLVVIQNQYLVAEEAQDCANILVLIVQPIRDVARSFGADSSSIPWYVIFVPDPIWNFSNGMVIVASILVMLAVGLGVPCGLLSIAAHSAKQYAIQLSGRHSAQLASRFDISPAELPDRLKMRWWPFAYPGFNLMIVAQAIVFLSIFWYRLAPFLFGLALLIALGALVRKWSDLMKRTL